MAEPVRDGSFMAAKFAGMRPVARPVAARNRRLAHRTDFRRNHLLFAVNPRECLSVVPAARLACERKRRSFAFAKAVHANETRARVQAADHAW
jgi:hypothetical protein